MTKFSWSHTSIQTFKTCPAQYAAKYFYKTIKFVENAAAAWGNEVHTGAESLLKGGEYKNDKVTELIMPYVAFFDKVQAESGCERQVELEICVNRNWKPTGWFAPDAWGRAKLDLVHIGGDAAHIYDWKTGKYKKDEAQLKIFCVMLALARPDIEYFDAQYIWLKDKKSSSLEKTLHRKDLVPLIKELQTDISIIQEAWEYESFPEKRNGLCKKYCDVITCKYCGV